MKKLYFLLAALFLLGSANAQIVFPDPAFKAKLLSANSSNQVAINLSGMYFKIDSNSDGEIQVSEALQVKQLRVGSSFITDITGILEFANIEWLDLYSNQISTLNLSGLSQLNQLVVYGNPMTSIDLSYTNLSSVVIEIPQLVSLNMSNTPISSILCSDSQLSELNIDNCPDLSSLAISSNQLTSLDLSGHPFLYNLGCANNQLTSLDLTGFTYLHYVDAKGNFLTNFDVSGLDQLEQIVINDNQLTSIDVTGCTKLNQLLASNNSLTTLDISTCTTGNEGWFDVQGNPIEMLFVKNGRNETVHFDGANVTYICADESQIASLTNEAFDYTVNSYCSFTPGGDFYTIEGNVHVDLNTNGCDTNDPVYSNIRFHVTNGTISSDIITDDSGEFVIPVQAGSHTITPVFENPDYFTAVPASINVTFPDQASPFVQDFCITPNGLHRDLEVTVLPLSPVIPGFDTCYKIVYKNKGVLTESGTITFSFDDALFDLVSTSQIVSSQSAGLLSWDFTGLEPFGVGEILVCLNANTPMETPPMNGGEILTFGATIDGSTSEETPADNIAALSQIAVNSLDPNDKTCLEGTAVSTEMIGKYVHYMIRFENTGTFPATNIVVSDMIDITKFDINSLVPISASHNFTTRISGGNKVEFIFENINLPFDNANNDGYVAFKIMTLPTLVEGDTFSNGASIYFDYNFPILTDMAITTIQTLGNPDFEFSDYFTLYPNPAQGIMNIVVADTIEIKSISVYNMLGQLVLAIPDAQTVSSIDVSNLEPGNYFIKINSDKGATNAKFVKN